MGDAGEGLVDTDSKIQERMEELQMSRAQARKPAIKNQEARRKVESLKLARKEMERQLENTPHAVRRTQITSAIEDLDRRIAGIEI